MIRPQGVGRGGGYSDFYLIHRLTLFFGGGGGGVGSKFWNLLCFEVWYFSYHFRVCQFGRLFFFGISFLTAIVWGVSFQNKAFCNVFLMYSLIKCSIFTIYGSNLVESIKILYKFNNLVAYFCQHHGLQYIVLVLFWVLRHWQVFFGVCQKSLVFFFFFVG